MFAELVVNVPHLTQTYHYAIPPELAGGLRAGHLVTVPFAGRKAQGLVVGLSDSAPVKETKTIEGLVDPDPVLTQAQLDLAYWISHTYLAPLIECLTLMLPPGLSKSADVLYASVDSQLPERNGVKSKDAAEDNLTPTQQSLLRLLKNRGPLRGRQIDRALPKTNWRAAAEALVRRGRLTRQGILETPSVRAKHVRTARLAASLQQVEEATHSARLSKHAPKAARLTAVLDFLADEFDPVDVSWVYAETGCNLQDLKDLAELGLVELGESEVWRDSLAGQEFVPVEPPELTPDQDKVWEVIRQRISRMEQMPEGQSPSVKSVQSVDNTFLLHGVTGSGKTEIYLRALGETIRQGQQAIVLVPEIALTPQTVRRFAARFPGRVAVWHSQLGEGERYDTWRRARSGLVDVVIGARSALFAPLPHLGLIVLDEEHDEAYKQDPPFSVPYHARDTAVEYAKKVGAVCLLGSATPDLVSYHRAKHGEYQLLELPQRIMGHKRKIEELAQKYHVESHYQAVSADAQTIDLPPVDVVDMRQELRAGNTSIFSRRLQAALTDVLARREQAILFLNRRGTATFVFCRDCGEALKCARCEMPLTYHASTADGSEGQMICHHCNNRRGVPKKCPQCGSGRIRYFGAGTQKLEEAVHEQFPQARTLRWDYDVTRFKGAHDLILQQFTTQQADVLIGTQMIAKGLDLPLVTLVGVISADVGLGLPDYRAAERNFQILTQVAGRAGRSLLGGRVILQTYQPEHYAIQAASKHDYAEFFARELRYRKELGYPPFRRVMRMVYRHARSESAEAEANVVARQLQVRLNTEKPVGTDLSGPAPCFFGKIAGEYRWQIVVRSPDPAALARDKVFKGWYIDVDPMSTL
jgi:primosomal protein N' (replication factor Y)